MRSWGAAAGLVLALVAGGTVQTAYADDPSRQDVEDAAGQVVDAADDVASVQAQLAVVASQVQEANTAAEQASEAYNGARYAAKQARQEARQYQERADAASGELEVQRQAYAGTVADSYQMSPSLSALAAITGADGIDTVLGQTATLDTAEGALDDQYDTYLASAAVADGLNASAKQKVADAEKAEDAAQQKKEEAQAAAEQAQSSSQQLEGQRTALLQRLADLQNTTYALAARGQSAAESAAETAAIQAALDEANAAAASVGGGVPGGTGYVNPTAPKPGKGAQAAIDFAMAQLGEPYVWGAAGPNAWDCSGLTSGAWAWGGKTLPHYSVAQYQQSTPIGASQLQPGDLVFWGTTNDPSTIHHVALYIGDGKIIHAPRTGQPVQISDMYYWIAPNFFARP